MIAKEDHGLLIVYYNSKFRITTNANNLKLTN